MNRKKNEKGVALILALILMLIISVMAVSLMFISQTETWASMNYKLMSQARDGAEAGINAAANYLINTYTPPASTGTDVLSSYNYNVSAVQYPPANSGNHDVVLATSNAHKANNYPVSSVVTAFQGAAQGNLTAGGGVPVTTAGNGNIGTNGNLAQNGGTTTINGNLSTPRTGTGTCSSGNVTAWTNSNGTVTGGMVELPQQVFYPNPDAPNPAPPTTSITLDNSAGNCGGVIGCTYGTGAPPGGNGCPSGDFCLAPGICPPPTGGPVSTT